MLCCAMLCRAASLVVQVLPKVKQQLQATQRDVATVAADLQRGVHRNIREISQQLEVSGTPTVTTCRLGVHEQQRLGHSVREEGQGAAAAGVEAQKQWRRCVSADGGCCTDVCPGRVRVRCVFVQSQSNEALRGLTRTLDAATAEAEVTLAPIARKQAEAAQRQLQQLEKQLKEAASEYERSGRQQPQGSSSSSSSCRHTRRHLEAASSSAGDWA